MAITQITRIPVVKRPATTVSGVLRQAHNLLEEEGRWVTGSWFEGDPIIDPQAPLCGSWSVCADGALIAVVLGVPASVVVGLISDRDSISDGSPEQQLLVAGSREAIAQQVPAYASPYTDTPDPESTVVSFNDDSTRDDVLAVFRKAYRHAQYVERKARANGVLVATGSRD